MAKVQNDFTADLLALLKIATDLNHLLTFVPWLHTMAEPTVKKSSEILEKMGGPPNSFGPATGSSIINILHDGKYITRAPAGKRISIGPDVDRMAEEISGRMNASILTTLHETWEIYVKSAYAKLLFHLKDKLSPPKREGFHQAMRNWRAYRNTPPYFRDYAQWSCRVDCSEALRVFGNWLAWDEIHVKLWNGMEWLAVARLLAFCRHRIVHNEGRVSEAQWKKLNKEQTKFVRAMMKKSILSEDERILPPAKMVGPLIEAIMSFAYGLYALVSQRCGCEVGYALFKKVPASRETKVPATIS